MILLSLETPNDVQSIATENTPRILKQLAKALIRLAYPQAGLSLCWLHIPHCWKSHDAAHLAYAPAKFEVATSNTLGGDAFTKIITNAKFILIKKYLPAINSYWR